MKRLKYLGAVVLTALIGLCACSSDSTSSAPASKSQGLKVNLTIGNGGVTRAAEPTDLGGFARENAIDGEKLYAVVFDTQGKFSKTYAITDYNAADGSCSFTLDAAGAYYGYIVANTSKGTALQGLSAGTSTEDDFYNIVEDTDPGASLAASTHFLMISKRTLFDVDGENATTLDPISLYRAVARIDIDVTAIPGLEITEVTVENRYIKSLLVRGTSPDPLTTATDTKVYTRGTGAGQVDAIAAGPSATALVTDQQWQGVIYGYENTGTNTIVKITHTMNGVASTTTVDFSAYNSGAGMALKRNNIYTVKLTDGAGDGTLRDINATILVTDWDESTSLKYTELTDNAKPDFKVVSSHSASVYGADGDAATKLNPGKVLAKKSDATTEIELEVTSNGKVASVVSFLDKNGSPYDFTGAGGDITQTGATTLVDGKIVQNFTITIPQDVVTAMSTTDYLTFKVNNVFNDTPTASREFVVSQRDIKMNPLWYVAEYNMLNTKTGDAYDMASTENAGYFFSWSDAMTAFAAQTASYSDYKTADKTITGYEGTWHLPVPSELLCIVPGNEESIWNLDNGSGTYKATNQTVIFGYSTETKAGISEASYWKKISDTEIHAIRFLGTSYCSAWKYELLGGWTNANYGYLRISATLIEVENSESAVATWYTTNWSGVTFGNDEFAGAVQRTFYARGWLPHNSGPTANGNQGALGYYWSTSTSTNSSKSFFLYLLSGAAYVSGSYDNSYGSSIRLFRDN